MVGDGSGEACGRFNRRLAEDVGLLDIYLSHVLTVMPTNKNILTMDFDMTGAEQIEHMKKFFSVNGYSVWIMTR